MLVSLQYERLENIGEGSFGVVDKYHDKVTSEIVAKKRILFDKMDEGVPSAVIREVSLLKELEHGNIVR